MINISDQTDLLKLIANYLDDDLQAYAIGGTAMMFHGYKATTKDIDLVFASIKERDIFIKAITALGYTQQSTKGIYGEKKPEKPLLFSRGNERFDLFVKHVFSLSLETIMKTRMRGRFDFVGKKHSLILLTPSAEDLVLLKAITGREKDFDDIVTICQIEKIIDWDYITEEAITQTKKNTKWIILDLEETMKRLKEFTIIEKRHFEKLYKSI